MPKLQAVSIRNRLLVLAASAALAACSHAEAVMNQPAPETAVAASAPKPVSVAASAPAPAVAAAPVAPMTREKASTDCWMKYEKEGRGMSLDQRLPLVEKCTAEKLKAAR
jgi:hypothetical protein